MATEIERKFLVRGDAWRTVEGVPYLQGYLASAGGVTVRVRMAGPKGKLTIKGPSQGASRAEFEYDIPADEAQIMLKTLCKGPLIDEFFGDNAGLIVSEIELEAEDEAFELPSWAGAEVTHLKRYFNARLVERPFSAWTPEEQAGR